MFKSDYFNRRICTEILQKHTNTNIQKEETHKFHITIMYMYTIYVVRNKRTTTKKNKKNHIYVVKKSVV